MNTNFKVPNMGSIANTGKIDNKMSDIVHRINESVGEITCPICGAKFISSDVNNDGSTPTCPVCNTPITANAYDSSSVDPEDDIVESYSEALSDYFDAIDNGDSSEAKSILESAGLSIEVGKDGLCTICEKVVSTAAHFSGGKLVKKHKTKLTAKQIKARSKAMKKNKKARKNAHKAGAMRKRKKSMKKSMKMRESLTNSYEIYNGIKAVLESYNIPASKLSIMRFINESKSVNEGLTDDMNKVVSTLETSLTNKGLHVNNSDTDTDEDGVIIVDVSVKDADTEVFLGEVADEVAEALDCEVDYDEPEDDDDEGDVSLTFYLLPHSAIEEKKCNEEDCDDKDDMDDKDKKDKKDECDKNESFSEYAGGASNVRCQLNPAFIRPGQLIYDADQHTVFKALTESVHSDKGYDLSIDVINSSDSKLSGMEGANVSITSDGRYFLLKSNPVG